MEEAPEHNNNKNTKHLVLVPCHLQGHITPMLQLASILHSKGFSIIIAYTQLIPPHLSSTHKDFIFLPMGEENLSDHITPRIDPLSAISIINKSIAAPLHKTLAQFIQQNPNHQVGCIIYDILMYSAENVASQLNLQSIILCTSSISSTQLYSAILCLGQNGCFPPQDSLILEEPVPQLYPIRYKELVHFIRSFGDFEGLVKLAEILCSKLTRASAVILNSLEHMERDSLAQFQCEYHQARSFAIGPLHKIAPTISTSLLSEDIDCMRWLDSQPKNSVIYVSIGSLITMEASDLTEMAWGLANSEQTFLWVLRPGSIIGSHWIEHLPEGFKETVGQRGCIVKWAPQKEVLAHNSVGGFWSHCGWNSTLESICEGVPIICRPKISDQWVNARYLNHEWKVALELDNVLNRENIEKAVKKLMTEVEGDEMRQRAASFKEMAQVAIAKGGTSYNSLNSLVELILSL